MRQDPSTGRFVPGSGTPWIERFWPKVERTATCWLVKPDTANGYAHLNVGPKRVRPMHVLAWEIASGIPIVRGEIVCHTCDVRNCVRNDEPGVYVLDGVEYPRFGHLFLATRSTNIKDMWRKGRARPGNGQVNTPSGAAHWNSRLNDEIVREIRRRARTQTLTSIAKMFGVHIVTVADVVSGKTWRHVV